MPELTISQVARQVGLQASAVRYYERIGLLPRAPRRSGQRRYDTTALYRLAIIQRARQLGFTLTEIRYLFFGFRDIASVPISKIPADWRRRVPPPRWPRGECGIEGGRLKNIPAAGRRATSQTRCVPGRVDRRAPK